MFGIDAYRAPLGRTDDLTTATQPVGLGQGMARRWRWAAFAQRAGISQPGNGLDLCLRLCVSGPTGRNSSAQAIGLGMRRHKHAA